MFHSCPHWRRPCRSARWPHPGVAHDEEEPQENQHPPHVLARGDNHPGKGAQGPGGAASHGAVCGSKGRRKRVRLLLFKKEMAGAPMIIPFPVATRNAHVLNHTRLAGGFKVPERARRGLRVTDASPGRANPSARPSAMDLWQHQCCGRHKRRRFVRLRRNRSAVGTSESETEDPAVQSATLYCTV